MCATAGLPALSLSKGPAVGAGFVLRFGCMRHIVLASDQIERGLYMTTEELARTKRRNRWLVATVLLGAGLAILAAAWAPEVKAGQGS